MKKILLSLSALVCVVGMGAVLSVAWGQAKTTTTVEIPHKIGLIDMGFLFTKYNKFMTLREDLKAEIEGADGQLKTQVDKVRALQLEMKDLVPSSPDYVEREKKATEMMAKIEADRKTMQREFMRKETKIYQTIYGEVQDAVNKYAKVYKYTLILRYSREEPANDDPQKVMASLQRQVVFSRSDEDITDSVLRFLNNSYEKSPPAPKPAPRTGGITTKGTTTN